MDAKIPSPAEIAAQAQEVRDLLAQVKSMPLAERATAAIEMLRKNRPEGAVILLHTMVEDLTWSDGPLPEDEQIQAAHPVRSGDHETYAEARRLVGARHSKHALIDLVNWLLHEAKRK